MSRQARQSDLRSKFNEPLHHAYVVCGKEEAVNDILGFLEDLGYGIHGNPDLYIESFAGGMSVDSARKLHRQSLAKPLSNDKKFFVLWVPQITIEAQNALLKILEEPSGESHFFIVAPSSGMFIPTVLSRVEVMTLEDKEGPSVRELELAEDFLKISPSERLSLAEKIGKEKDKQTARALVTGLLIKAEAEVRKNPTDKEWRELLREVSQMERFIKGRSPSIKMILEHLALLLPIIK